MSRPDIVCALHKCAVWQNKPSEKLWKNIIWIIKYLKHTLTQTLTYERQSNAHTYTIYCDASFGGERKGKSRIGYVLFFKGALVAWCSKKSNRVLTSSTEAECAAVIEAAKENAWVSKFVEELSVFRREQEATVIFQDNKGVISLKRITQKK